MSSSSTIVPSRPTHESVGSTNEVSTPNHIAPPPEGDKPARPTIKAIRIPTNGDLPYLTSLQLVKASSDYHFNIHDPNLLHHSNADNMQNVNRHCRRFLDPTADDAQIDPDDLYDSRDSVYERAQWPPKAFECDHRLHSTSYDDGKGIFLDVPLTEKSDEPHMTFTHASLRSQPNVVEPYWKSGEAWSRRAFKRLHAAPRETAHLEMITGEYHIMYTLALKGLSPNKWARYRVYGDAFVLKMASGKNEEGDWYYEDVPEEILRCSLGNQCLETLRSVRPVDWEMMVGERGNGPFGWISAGTGLKGKILRM